MHTTRWSSLAVTAGLVVALTIAAGTTSRAAQTGSDTSSSTSDLTVVGPSIEEHLAKVLPNDAGNVIEKLNKVALQDAQELGLERPGSGDANRRNPRDPDYPSFGNPGPAPVQDATQHELVGIEREWLALDDTGATPGSVFGYYGKNYRLAAVGDHIEVWVAIDDNASYDAGTGIYSLPFDQVDDCRNSIEYDGATRIQISGDQINQLVADFDLNIYPEITTALATPPDRSGANALYNAYDKLVFGDALPDHLEPDYFVTPDGADRTVALIDNVRDDAYYIPPDQEALTYIAGFFSPFFNAAFDRNVMTIDAFDWLHRTGANPPDDSGSDPCLGAAARPFLYEGVFAHEWQHLLQSYVGGEFTWVNEGLSDWVTTLTGYETPWRTIDERGYSSHIQCFTGFLATETPYNLLPRENSGPENSLTWWEDQGPGEILCDYGAAYSFMEYTYGQLGQEALQFLFAEPAPGLEGVQLMLEAAGDGRSAQQYLHDWTAAVALDARLDDNAGALTGGDAATYQTPTLHAAVDWNENDAYDTPGAPPNGSDYVVARDAQGNPMRPSQVRSVTFTGDASFTADPTPWTVEDDAGDQVLYSQAGDGLDNSIAWSVNVPSSDPTLTFDTKFSIEYAWDYGFVQVSTDGGQTWTSLANGLTTSDINDNPGYEQIAAQVPGLSGDSVSDGAGGLTVDPTNAAGADWGTVSFDLSAYAGQDVMIGFRYMTDGAFVLPGWWVDDVAVGGQLLTDGSSTAGGQSYEELAPPPIDSWHLTIVGLKTRGDSPAAIVTRDVEPGEALALSRQDLRRFQNDDVLGVIVTMGDPTESVRQYGNYELTINNVIQPGG